MAPPNSADAAPNPAPVPHLEATFLTVKLFAEREPALTEGGIRWAIHNEDSNGLADSGAVVRVGRRVLIDPALFMGWMRTSPQLSPPKPKPGQKFAPRARRQSLPRPAAMLEA